MNVNNTTIKESITLRAMELWGIEDRQLLDPVIELLLDVFSYEFSKVEQSIKISDSKLLERISKILVQEKWSLPLPSHALLKAIPTTDEFKVNRNTSFYLQKAVQDNEYVDIFFTPVNTHKLINANIKCIGFHQELLFKDSLDHPTYTLQSLGNRQIADYTVWVGIDIKEKLLKKLESINISLMLNNSNLDTYLKMVKVYDIDNNEIEINPLIREDNTNNEHYFDAIQSYYQNYLYSITLHENKRRSSTMSNFENNFSGEDLVDVDEDLFWLKFVFPVSFTVEELSKLEISLNSFPVVNRKLHYKQHNVKKNGKIISLRTLNEYFLNIEEVLDDKGRAYVTTTRKDIKDVEGSYSLYSGELEQFDERNAKAILEQVIQKVREEGSSFSAIGYDLLNAHLDDLNKKLDILERKVSIGYKNITDTNNRQYLLTSPYKDIQNLECSYWTTDAVKANGILKNTPMSQFHTNEIIPRSIRLLTGTVGGNYKDTVKEKISNLRYGLLSKDRIVSKEDVKEFVKVLVGKTIKDVVIKSGVSISSNSKQGLIRTTNVFIELQSDSLLTPENKKRLGNYVQTELENKSVHNLPYSVYIK